MGIKKIEVINVQDSGILKDHSIEIKSMLNIIYGGNGTGKTTFLRGIVTDFHKSHSIHALLSSIQHFKSFPNMTKYANASSSLRPPQARQFMNEYRNIPQLMDNLELIEDCNSFFEKLGVSTRLHLANTEGGWLLFRNPHHKSKFAVDLDTISPGERTIFILWLLTKSTTKPDVLILDEFDAHISGINDNLVNGDITSVFIRFFQTIIDEFVNKGVQVFLATNRIIPQDLHKYYTNLNDLMQEWKIHDGKIQPK